ncbi:hypothetical protein GWI33_013765 [Rhynchophorus ferrugineus]|uniref:Glutamyl-tRNA(Gln) amidotransferase subunit B, mitochondrial n=1 Tax=Rhynchophorus ferrugineus TaxID=354439 RepID=A0A834IGE4_RHYFE|nr:hypothetical protein GWI33_013765 [Rhynchophorus ferrugineus]
MLPSGYRVSKRVCSNIANKRSKWKSVVGLEVHAQIQSKSKLFSGAPTKFSAPINSNVCLFDMAIPGTLPVLNKYCVEAGVLTALALNCQINPVSYFDRKHYFYADMPAGYQITQQRAPLAQNGSLEFNVFTPAVHKSSYKTKVGIKQLQLEQDSGKSLHDFDRSLIDLNRAGIPLMEVVFEPDLTDGEEAAALIKELIGILQRLQTCSCKMEEGALRVDANVSVNKEGEPLGTRTEIKNIASVKGIILNETRAWNAEKKVTVPMRDKEVQQDYRYMPEPNLPPLHIAMGPVSFGSINADKIKETLPELPEQARRRLRDELGLTLEQSIILVNDNDLLNIFEVALSSGPMNTILFANFLINDLYTALNKLDLEVKDLGFKPTFLGDIVKLVEKGEISRNTAKLVLDELLKGGTNSPIEIIEKNNWKQISDEAELIKICESIINDEEKIVKDYLSGKQKAFKALLGVVSRKTQNRANMTKCNEIFKKLLSKRIK